MLVGAPTPKCEFDGVSFADNDQTLSNQAASQRGAAFRPSVTPYGRSPSDDPALDLNKVLQRNRHPVQWTNGVAGSNSLIGGFRREAGILCIDLDKGVELRILGGDPV